MTFLLATLLAVPQDARELVEKLRSESVVDRQDAARKLKELGEAARPVLEQAANDPDGEVATRARHLLRLLGVRTILTAAFKKAFPEAEEELSVDGDAAALKFFLQTMGNDPSERPRLFPHDADPLAAGALRGAKTPEALRSVLDHVAEHRLPGAAPAIAALFAHDDSNVREGALDAAIALALPVPADRLEEFLERRPRGREDRLKAARALCHLRSPDHLPRIAKLLDDPHGPIQVTALEAVADLGAREAIPQVLGCLDDSDLPARTAAFAALHALDAREFLPTILDRLPRSSVPPGALRLLRDWRPKGATAYFRGILSGDEPGRRAWAAELLGHMQAEEGLPDLKVYRNETWAQEALLRMDSAQGPGDLLGHLRDEDSPLRECVTRLVVLGHSPRTAPELLSLLEDRRPEVVARGIGLLGRIYAASAIPSLKDVLDRPEHEAAAVDGLGRMGASEASPYLLRRLREAKDPIVRLRAIRDLVLIRPPEAAAAIDRLVEDPDADLRIAALRALFALDRSKGQTRAVEMLRDGDWRVREAALLRLIRYPVPGAGPTVLTLLVDPESRIRPLAIRATGRMGTEGAIDVVRKLLQSRDGSVVEPAIEAAETLNAKESVPELRALLGRTIDDFFRPEDEPIGARAAWALARLGGEAEGAHLLKAFPGLPAQGQAAVVQALGWIRSAEGAPLVLQQYRVSEGRPDHVSLGRALGSAHPKGAVDVVLAEVARGVAGSGRVLGEFEADDRIDALVGLLQRRSAATRREALEALRALKAAGAWRSIVPLLKDRHPDVRTAAARTLGALVAPDPIPELFAVPREGSHETWLAARRALCRLGRREGAEAMIPEAAFELNALREPALWSRLRTLGLRKDLTGTSLDLLCGVLMQAGLDIEIPELASADLGDRFRWIRARSGRTSVLDALEELLEDLPAAKYGVFLEKDRLRVVPRSDARWLWRRWFEATQ